VPGFTWMWSSSPCATSFVVSSADPGSVLPPYGETWNYSRKLKLDIFSLFCGATVRFDMELIGQSAL